MEVKSNIFIEITYIKMLAVVANMPKCPPWTFSKINLWAMFRRKDKTRKFVAKRGPGNFTLSRII